VRLHGGDSLVEDLCQGLDTLGDLSDRQSFRASFSSVIYRLASSIFPHRSAWPDWSGRQWHAAYTASLIESPPAVARDVLLNHGMNSDRTTSISKLAAR
jgi:hypothetical protein